MSHTKIQEAGKVLFLAALLMSSVGLSPRYLMLAEQSNQEEGFISLASTVAIRKTVDGKVFELTEAASEVEEYVDADDNDKKKFRKRTKVNYSEKASSATTEACADCLLTGTVDVQVIAESDVKNAKLPIADIVAKIQEDIKKAAAAKTAKDEAAQREASNADYKKCKKVDPKLKARHDDQDHVALAACHLEAADADFRKGRSSESEHWVELRNMIALASTSKDADQKAILSALERWSKKGGEQISESKSSSEISSHLKREILDTIEAHKVYARMEGQLEGINRSIMSSDSRFQSAQRRYEIAQQRESEAMNDPSCMYSMQQCWMKSISLRNETMRAMNEVARTRDSALNLESKMLGLSPRSLMAFEIKRPYDGGIFDSTLADYYQDYTGSLERLVGITGNTSLLRQAEYDLSRMQDRLPYEMANVGFRGSNYGLQTPVIGGAAGLNGNFAGRTARGGLVTSPTIGAGRGAMAPTSAFSTLQAFSGVGDLYTRPYTGVDIFGTQQYYGGAPSSYYTPSQLYQRSQSPVFQGNSYQSYQPYLMQNHLTAPNRIGGGMIAI